MFSFSSVFSNNKANQKKKSINQVAKVEERVQFDTTTADNNGHNNDPAVATNYPAKKDAKKGPLTLLMKKNDDVRSNRASHDSGIPRATKNDDARSRIVSHDSGISRASKHSQHFAQPQRKQSGKKSPNETFFADARRRSTESGPSPVGTPPSRNTSQVKFRPSEPYEPKPSQFRDSDPFEPGPSQRETEGRLPRKQVSEEFQFVNKFKGCRNCCTYADDYRNDQNLLCGEKYKNKYANKGKSLNFTQLQIQEKADLIRQPEPKPKSKEPYVIRAKQNTPLSRSLQELFDDKSKQEPTGPFGCTTCSDRKAMFPVYKKCEDFMCSRNQRSASCQDCTVTKHYYERDDDLPYKLVKNFEDPKWTTTKPGEINVSPLYKTCRSGMCDGGGGQGQPMATDLHKLKESFPKGYLVTQTHGAEDAQCRYCSEKQQKALEREDRIPLKLPTKPACQKCKCREKCGEDPNYDIVYDAGCTCECHNKVERPPVIMKDPTKNWWEK